MHPSSSLELYKVAFPSVYSKPGSQSHYCCLDYCHQGSRSISIMFSFQCVVNKIRLNWKIQGKWFSFPLMLPCGPTMCQQPSKQRNWKFLDFGVTLMFQYSRLLFVCVKSTRRLLNLTTKYLKFIRWNDPHVNCLICFPCSKKLSPKSRHCARTSLWKFLNSFLFEILLFFRVWEHNARHKREIVIFKVVVSFFTGV